MIKATNRMSKTPRKPAEVNRVNPSICPSCGSCERTEYRGTREMEFKGVENGMHYDKVIWRYTTCRSCNQVRIDSEKHFIGFVSDTEIVQR